MGRVNERDEIGSDLVPDYITSVRDGGFYGWPYSYFGQHVDVRVKPPRPDLVARAISPDFAIGPHVAALGLTFSSGQRLGPAFAQGAFVGEHGSWNRSPPSGAKVVFVPFGGATAVGNAGRRAHRFQGRRKIFMAARSGSKSGATARFSSPTTSATPSGESPRAAKFVIARSFVTTRFIASHAWRC